LIRWLKCVADGRCPQIYGDGGATMDFVYVEDVARANILAMEAGRVDDVYNVASGTETSLIELWQIIQKVTGACHLQPEFHPPPPTVKLVLRRQGDTGLARDEINFSVRVCLEEGIRRLSAWYSEESSRFRAV
jgi:UDP-glucose 4-epimerase